LDLRPPPREASVRERDVVVVGASAGGVENLMALARDLPADLPAAVLVVLHIPAAGPSVLPSILDRAGPLPAGAASDGEPLLPGRIYVAPPDCHLLVGPNNVHLASGPKENGHRPAVDALFRSAAVAHGENVIAVILSGMLDDGSAGLLAVKQAGGTALVLDPATTVYTGMPANAIATVDVDVVAPIEGLAAAIVERAGTSPTPPEERAMYDQTGADDGPLSAQDQSFTLDDSVHHNHASGFMCPECGGALWEVEDDRLVRFNCHVGHSYSTESMLAAHDGELDRALFGALRALREKAALNRRLASRMEQRGLDSTSRRMRRDATQAERAANTLRLVILERTPHTDPAVIEAGGGVQA
jgi:two-component system, chemotaxis family, protein-glutamate methylesterase/glutaminase